MMPYTLLFRTRQNCVHERVYAIWARYRSVYECAKFTLNILDVKYKMNCLLLYFFHAQSLISKNILSVSNPIPRSRFVPWARLPKTNRITIRGFCWNRRRASKKEERNKSFFSFSGTQAPTDRIFFILGSWIGLNR